MDIQVGDTLRMKKAHPCGSARWEVLRIGADFRLRCLGCGREVMGPRSRFERNVRQIERETAQTPEPADTQEPPQGFQKREQPVTDAIQYLAHCAEDGRTQTVKEHLEATATLCSAFASAFGAKQQGFLIGLAHDIGKCSTAFQQRLHGGARVDHSTAGAYACAEQNAFWAACCVAGHHGGLPDFGNLRNDRAEDATLFGRLRKAGNGGIPPYHIPVSLPSVPAPEGYGMDPLSDSFMIRMLYSCLVDADYLDTERFMSDGAGFQHDSGETIPALLDKLNRHIQPLWNPTRELNRIRCGILKNCIDAGAQDRGFYTLTVPTGGGKTIASMAFALHHAAAHGMQRVIYVIPFTSIIEQTAEVFRGIFGAQNVVEHHSNAVYEVGEGGDPQQYRNIRATENWDAPIIISTAVQFFESLYSNRSSKCRKLHNIANSVIIFDEAQTLPVAHLRACTAAIAKLVTQFRTTAVLCTATQPVLNDLFAEYAPGFHITELCPNTKDLYSQLRRVSIRNAGRMDIDALSAALCAKPQVLCIVNSRKAAQEVFSRLPGTGSYHLSTLMFPAHRRAVLAEIRARLLAGLPCRVVSTSLIEAGVDVDFPAVYREIAGLDSILQAAGRCNREGRFRAENSIVTIFKGISKTPQILQANIGAAEEILARTADPAAPETVSDYFKVLRSLLGSGLDKYDVIRAFQKGVQGRMLPFRTVAEHFHLISDASKTVYIPLDGGEALVQRFRAGERSRTLFRELGQYGVSVYEAQYQKLFSGGMLSAMDENSAVLTDVSQYQSRTGLTLQDEATLLCI